MPHFLDLLWLRPDFWWLLAIPLVAAILGGLGNWLSVQLLFGSLPLAGRYRQGILAAHAKKVAPALAETLASRFCLSELFRLMEPEKIAHHVSDTVLGRLDAHVADIMSEKYAVLWDNLPELVRQRVYVRIRRQLPSILDNLVDDMAENIDALVDMRELMTELLDNEPVLLVRLFEAALQTEVRFMRRVGVGVGLVLGLLELVLWSQAPRPWLLPIMAMGIVVVAHWLPRQLLFWPSAPFKPGFFARHGWLYRQPSALPSVLAGQLTADVFNLRRFMQSLLEEERVRRTRSMIRRHMQPLMDAGMVRISLQLVLGAEGYAYIKQRIVDRAVMMTLGVLAQADIGYAGAGLVQGICTTRLHAMPVLDRQNLVRLILDEGLWLQWSVMAIVGMTAGLLQWLLWSALG